jgi:hypothetical protein
MTTQPRKTRCFQARAEFVGVNITKEGNSPAEAKHCALRGLEQLLLCTDLRMLMIGSIGFNRKWMPVHADRTVRWRDHLETSPAPMEATKEKEVQQLKEKWTTTKDELLDELKEAIFSSLVLKDQSPTTVSV